MSKNIVTSLNTDDLIKVYDRFTSNRIDTNRFITKAGLTAETTPSGSLQMEGGVLDTTLRVVETANGTNSALQISTNAIKVVGDTAGFGSAGLIIGGFNSTTGGIWYSGVIPGGSNYAFLATSGNTYLNCSTETIFELSGIRAASYNTNGFLIGAGSVTQNGTLTVKGSGANIQSWRDSTNVERASMTNAGAMICQQLSLGAFNVNILPISDGIAIIRNSAATGFSRLILGTNDTAGVAIKKNGTAIDFRLGDDSGYASISAATVVALSGVQSYGTIEAYNTTTSITVSGPIKWGSTSSFPMLKRNAAELEARFADDSNFCNFQAAVGRFTGLNTSAFTNNFAFGSNANVKQKLVVEDNVTPSAITTSAIFEVKSTTLGFLPPRMTATEASAISTPADGLIVYVNSTNGTFTSVGLWCRVAGAWTKL